MKAHNSLIGAGGSQRSMDESLEAEPAGQSERGHPDGWRTDYRQNLYSFIWLFQLAIAVLFTPLSTRLLRSGQFGRVAAAIAVTQVVYALGNLQLQASIRREFDDGGEDRARRLVFLSTVLAVFATAVAYVTGPLWSPALGFGPFDGVPRWAVLTGGLIAITGGGLGLLRSQDRLGPFGAAAVLQSVGGQLLAVVLVLTLHRTATTFVLGLLFAQTAAAGVALIYARPKWMNRSELVLARRALEYSIPLVPGAVAAVVLSVADRLILLSKLGPTAVGRYQVAASFGAAAIAVVGGVNLVLLPRILASPDSRTRTSALAVSRDSMYKLLLPIVVGACVGAPVLLRLAAPPSYQPQGLLVPFTLLAFSAIPYAGGLAYARVLLAAGQTWTLAWAVVVAAAIDIDLNFVLIPTWHIVGSAIATLASYCVLSALVRWRANRELKLDRLPQSTSLLLVAATAYVWLWSQAPATTPWLVVRLLQATACLLWFILAVQDLRADRSGPLLRRQVSRRTSRRSTNLQPAAVVGTQHGSSVEADGAAATRRLRRGLPAGLIDSSFSSLASFLMGLVATHYLLPQQLGEYAVFYAAFLFAAVVPATLIFTPIEVDALELERDKRLSVFRHSIALGALPALLSGLLVVGVVIPLVAKVGLAARVEFGATVVALACISPTQDHIRRMFHQAGRSWIAARLSIIQVLVVAVLIVLSRLVNIPLPLVPFGALAIGNLVSAAEGLRISRSFSGEDVQTHPHPLDVLRAGGWLTFGTAFGYAAGLAAVAILTDRSSAVATGEAEAARILSQPVTVIAVGILAVFGPEMMSAAQRGLTRRVGKMMIGFLGVIVLTTLFWLLAVGVPWPWSPITRAFSTAYAVKGLTPWMIVQQSVGYASLAYRSVLIGNGLGRRVGMLDVGTGVVVVIGVYITAPYIGAFSLVWVFLGADALLFGVRARMATTSMRNARAHPIVRADQTA
jgi:O-antigen/teichoic acid export membrane protein